MINKSLIQHIFKAASMERWNDFARIMTLSELDKQAHKFIIAFFMGKLEGVNMSLLIKAGVYELLVRIMITDIRPDVYHKLVTSDDQAMNEWALTQLKPLVKELENGDFYEQMCLYFKQNPKSKIKQILRASSYLATLWEFKIIKQSNTFLSDIDELCKDMMADLDQDFCAFASFNTLYLGKLARLVELSGRLRFQKRWSQTPRVPATTVLGHMLIVALLAYFYLLDTKASKLGLEASFYCALFHDLPESLTRDIISPVKYGAKIDSVLNEYEIELIKTKFLPCVKGDLQSYFGYILGLFYKDGKLYKDEFANKIFLDNKGVVCDESRLLQSPDSHPINGRMLKACDNLAAFLEAGISIHYGIKTKELESALLSLYKKLQNYPYFADLLASLVQFYELDDYL